MKKQNKAIKIDSKSATIKNTTSISLIVDSILNTLNLHSIQAFILRLSGRHPFCDVCLVTVQNKKIINKKDQ